MEQLVEGPPNPAARSRTALAFVITIGIVSLFADFTYEGSRSITGPYLAVLGASGTIVGVVAGLGELLGYGLRPISGRLTERTQKFWPITLVGYFVQMIAVPLLALAGNWPIAALLIVVERIGKATRNPPRDVMLSHAAKEIGYGWGFGIHEALDQFGALFGPLFVAGLLAHRSGYHRAFAALWIPAAITFSLLLLARWKYPAPEQMEASAPSVQTEGLPRVFWIYLIGAALVAAGFADFSLVAYHFQKTMVVPPAQVPIFYAVAMGISGLGSLVFGRVYDRLGFSVLIPLTLITSLSAPLLFLGGYKWALGGAALWGLGMGVHESIIPAVVAPMVSVQHRPSAYGLFTAGYGIFWFAGSAVIGVLYDVSRLGLIAFSVLCELAAIPIFLVVKKRLLFTELRRIAESGN